MRLRRLLRPSRRTLLFVIGAFLTATLAVELVGRLAFGLCDPPLMVADAELEYLFAPSQHCRQFGNDITFNRYSMRSDDFPETKASPDELRVMVFGDSVVYAGTKIDQRDLATSRLREALTRHTGQPVTVGNISAGSWGPQNQLAYAKRHGFFGADVVVIVLSSHDVSDTMTFDPVVGRDPSYPSSKPKLALWEIATRYLPRFIAIRRAQADPAAVPPSTPTETPERVATSMSALRELIGDARRSGVGRVIVAQHMESHELTGTPQTGHDVIRVTAEEAGAEIVQFGPAFKAAIDRGEQPYRDNIHPTSLGQSLIADALEHAILPKQEGPTTAATTKSH